MIAASLVACVILVLFSAFFSSIEIALTSLNRLRLSKLSESGSKTAKMTEKIEERDTLALSTILVGNNVVNIVLSSIATSVFLSVLSESMSEAVIGTVSTAVVTVVLLIFGEIIPKIVGKRLSLTLARAFSYPLWVIMIILRPLTIVITAFVNLVAKIWRRGKPEEPEVSEDELSAIIETVEEEGVIDENKGDLLHSALDFSDRTVEDILTPRVDLEALDVEDDVSDVIEQLLHSNHSRFPVYRDTVDHIIGVLYLAPFLKAVAERGRENVKLEDSIIKTDFVHKTTKLPDALERMRELKMHMLVVLDEYGGTLGVVTMEDILEDIVGDIWDETDVIENEITEVSENTYDVLGHTNIEDFFDEIDFRDHEFESEYTTVGGWAVEMLSEDPHVGDTFTYKRLEVTVTEMGDNIIEKLRVKVLPEEDESGEE